jgi:thymidylate synthase ThyX
LNTSDQEVEPEVARSIEAEILLDSVNPQGQRLTTFIFRGPRWLLAEVNTHRMLSRNAASSRAIPTEKMLKGILENGMKPSRWGANKPGMQAGDNLPPEEVVVAARIWEEAQADAVRTAKALLDCGLAKQWCNRIVEPFMQWTGLVSATHWDNFFALRAHKDAQDEFQILAFRALDKYLKSEPQHLAWGDWHIPFGDQMPEGLSQDEKIRVAIARAARLSYLTFDGELDVKKDLALYEKLMVGEPLHASPAEHVARAVSQLYLHSEYGHPSNMPCEVNISRNIGSANTWALPYDVNMVHQGNFEGFTQYRKMQKNECVHKADLKTILAGKPDWIEL